MVKEVQYKSLEHRILIDFNHITNINNDYQLGFQLVSKCFEFYTDGVLYGYQCYFMFEDFNYCSYFKLYCNPNKREYYKQIKNMTYKPLLSEDTNDFAYGNHTKPHHTGLIEIIL